MAHFGKEEKGILLLECQTLAHIPSIHILLETSLKCSTPPNIMGIEPNINLANHRRAVKSLQYHLPLLLDIFYKLGLLNGY